jgi:hypothetical protein
LRSNGLWPHPILHPPCIFPQPCDNKPLERKGN